MDTSDPKSLEPGAVPFSVNPMLSPRNAVYRFLGCLSSCSPHVPGAVIVNNSGDFGRVTDMFVYICGESATKKKKVKTEVEYNVFSCANLVTPLTSGTTPGSSILISQQHSETTLACKQGRLHL